MTSRRLRTTEYIRPLPSCFTSSSPLASSTPRWRVVVGHECAKRAAMSPAATLPPRMWIVMRIWRRAGCESAWKTASSASRRSSAGLLRCGIQDRDLEVLEDRRHRLPDRHDFRRLVRKARGVLVAPREDLDEELL